MQITTPFLYKCHVLTQLIISLYKQSGEIYHRLSLLGLEKNNVFSYLFYGYDVAIF